MEGILAKPRVSYSDFVAQQPKEPGRTVAWVIEMYIQAMNGFEGQRPIKV